MGGSHSFLLCVRISFVRLKFRRSFIASDALRKRFLNMFCLSRAIYNTHKCLISLISRWRYYANYMKMILNFFFFFNVSIYFFISIEKLWLSMKTTRYLCYTLNSNDRIKIYVMMISNKPPIIPIEIHLYLERSVIRSIFFLSQKEHFFFLIFTASHRYTHQTIECSLYTFTSHSHSLMHDQHLSHWHIYQHIYFVLFFFFFISR